MARRTLHEKRRAKARAERKKYEKFAQPFRLGSRPYPTMKMSDIPWGFVYHSRRVPQPKKLRYNPIWRNP